MKRRLSEDSGAHRMLAELDAAEDRLDRVCRLAHIGVIEAGEPFDDEATLWSDTVFEIFGRDPFLGPLSLSAMCSELVHPEDRAEVRAALDLAVATQQPSQVDFRIAHGDGTIGFIEGRFRPEWVDGQPVRWVGVLRDVTEHRRLEQELRRAQKMEALARLTAGIAHEYNNLLMGIQGCTGLALRRLDAAHAASPLVREAVRAAERGTRLTKELLDFSTRRKPARESVDLDTVIERVARMLRAVLGEQIAVSLRLGAPTWRFVGDEGQVEQVLVNLALNARDAMPDGGLLEIATWQARYDAPALAEMGMDLEPGDYVCLSVSDEGVGMDELTRERAFEPFFTTKRTGEGTGLGLSTVYGIARAGGDITVRSVPRGGTTFTLAFPRAPHDALVAEVEPLRSDPRPGSERILIVDDEELIRLTLSGYLAPHGYRVDQACDVFEASLQLSRERRAYDLVITDVMLPGGTGRQVQMAAERTHPGVPVIYMSAYPPENLRASERVPPDAVLMQKPFDEVVLMGLIRATLGPSRASVAPSAPESTG